jgi:uncharacterized membrane protein
MIQEVPAGRHSATEKLVLWYIPLAFAVFFIWGSVLQMRSFAINDADFGYFITQIWRVWNGWDWQAPFSNVYEGKPFYAHHCTPLSALLAPIVGPWKSPYPLSILQGAAVGAMAFILPRLVRVLHAEAEGDNASGNWVWTAAVVLVLFFFFRPVLTPWSRQAHYTTLVTPVLMLAVLMLHKRRWWALAGCCFVVLLAQERAAPSIFCLGMYAVLLLGQRRVGLLLCAVSGAWFVTVTKVWLPYMRQLAGAGSGYAFEQFVNLSGGWDHKLQYYLRLLAYSWFLPLLGRKALLCLLCTLPYLGMVALSGYGQMWDMAGQYEDLPGVFLMLAICHASMWVQGRLRPALWKKLLPAASALMVTVMMATQTGWYNPAATVARLLQHPDAQAHARLRDTLGSLPDFPASVRVWAQSGLGPHVFYPYQRYLADINEMGGPLDDSVVIISPYAGTYHLVNGSGGVSREEFEQAKAFFDAHASLELVKDNGVAVIYVGKKLRETQPDLVQALQRQALR